MNPLKPNTLVAAAALAAGLSLLPATRATAQNAAAATPSVSSSPAAPARDGGNPAGRDDFRQRMAERLKAQLKVTDDEWTVMQPLIEKVGEKMMASRGGGFGAFGPGGTDRRRRDNNNGSDNKPAGNNQPAADKAGDNKGGENRDQRRDGGGQRGGTPETQALRTALDDDNTTVNDIKAKLQAVRDQRKQAATELAQAREELRKVLNMRQEAALVMDGLLD